MHILIVTDLLFTGRMRGNRNRVSAYYEYLCAHHNVDVIDKITSSTVAHYLGVHSDTDFVIVPYIWNAHVLDDTTHRKAKFIVDTLDCMSSRTQRFEDAGHRFSKPYTAESEMSLLKLFDHIMAITEDDANSFRRMGFDNVFTVPYKFTVPPQKLKLGFIGGTSAHNTEAIKWFCDNVFKNRFETAFDLYICGEVARTDISKLYRDNKGVYFYSPIHKIEDFYRLIDITINPILFGSGMATKIMESLMFEKPVITTSVGLAGFSAFRHTINVADSVGDWVTLLNRIVSDKDEFFMEFRASIGNVARLCSSDLVYSQLEDVLNRRRPRNKE